MCVMTGCAPRQVMNRLPGGIPDPMLPQQPKAAVTGPLAPPPLPQEPVTLSTLKQDCIMLPMARMKRFYPAGHPVCMFFFGVKGNNINVLQGNFN